MKKTTLKLLLVVIVTTFASCSSSLNKSEVENMAVSESLVGVWRQMSIGLDGTPIPTGNYKFLNTDDTFYSMVFWGSFKPSTIMMYGNYEITSDSTYVESIVEHSNSKMSGTKSLLKYKLLDKNTLLLQYKNDVQNKWIPEIWKRVGLSTVNREVQRDNSFTPTKSLDI